VYSSSVAVASSSSVMPSSRPSSSSKAVSSSSSKPSSSSSSSVGIAYYCDYGYPTSYGGGCLLMKDPDNCNLEWGKVVTSCDSRKDLIYCHRGSNHCYSRTTTSCDSGDSKVSHCPENTLCNTSDCTYDCLDDYGPYGCRLSSSSSVAVFSLCVFPKSLARQESRGFGG